MSWTADEYLARMVFGDEKVNRLLASCEGCSEPDAPDVRRCLIRYYASGAFAAANYCAVCREIAIGAAPTGNYGAAAVEQEILAIFYSDDPLIPTIVQALDISRGDWDKFPTAELSDEWIAPAPLDPPIHFQPDE